MISRMKLRQRALLTACAVSLLIAPSFGQALGTIAIEGGQVSGVPSDTQGVTEFLGIPYAGNIGGDNRWRPAPPVEPWEGVLVADTMGPVVLQERADPATADNGLVLNVWTPAHTTGEKLPVYMLMHGGANRSGSNASNSLYAAELAAKGIVVVSVHYRLGAPGFLALPEMAAENADGAVGNYAVLDLVDALKWIRNNVAQFGGDPDMVTIGGQSAGAENAVALLRTPLANGLYKRAFISSSFTGFLPGKIVSAAEKTEANQAAVNAIFGKEMSLADLRTLPNEAWLEKQPEASNTLYGRMAADTVTRQFYTIDGHTYTDRSVDLLRPGALDGVDIMIGQTADELTGLRGGENEELTPEDFRTSLLSLEYPYMAGGQDERVLKLYQAQTDLDAYRLSLRAINDRLFAYVRIGAEYAEAHNPDADVWLFYWDHVPPGDNEGFRKAYHGADNYYFNASLRPDNPDQRPWTDPDLAMKSLASGYLANFIINGDPNGKGLPEWGQITVESGGQFMRFHEGEGHMVTQTVYPTRDAYHRDMILDGLGMTEADVFGR